MGFESFGNSYDSEVTMWSSINQDENKCISPYNLVHSADDKTKMEWRSIGKDLIENPQIIINSNNPEQDAQNNPEVAALRKRLQKIKGLNRNDIQKMCPGFPSTMALYLEDKSSDQFFSVLDENGKSLKLTDGNKMACEKERKNFWNVDPVDCAKMVDKGEVCKSMAVDIQMTFLDCAENFAQGIKPEPLKLPDYKFPNGISIYFEANGFLPLGKPTRNYLGDNDSGENLSFLSR
jgi:hypothetical protein